MANLNNLKLVFAIAFLFALIDFSYLYPTHNQQELSLVNQDSEESNNLAEIDEKEKVLTDFLLKNPKALAELLGYEYDRQMTDASPDASSNHLSRDRRRISVFKNIYNQCRIQKRKEKNFCLYLANLYQNVKGFHGL